MEFDIHPYEKYGLSFDDFHESRPTILNARLLYVTLPK
jgi:hypothetical protein